MAKTKSKAIPKPAAVAADQGNAQARASKAIEAYSALCRDLGVVHAIADVMGAVTDPCPTGADALATDSLFALSEHARDLLGAAQVQAKILFDCFHDERKAAEAAHG